VLVVRTNDSSLNLVSATLFSAVVRISALM